MKWQQLAENLKDNLTRIERKSSDTIACANKSIVLCRDLLRYYQKDISIKGFNSVEHEIKFFKKIKQIPFHQLIYYSEIRSFELQFPRANLVSQQKCIRRKIKKLNRFFLYNIDFGQYISTGNTLFDREYYTRDFLDTFHISTSKFYYQHPDFCTPRDILLAKYKAYDLLLVYLERRLVNLKKGVNGSDGLKQVKKLRWPYGNTAFVELSSALCAGGLHVQNNISIIEVTRRLQEVFDVEPKDIYNIRKEISKRKHSRTVFLDMLTTTLLAELDKNEE